MNTVPPLKFVRRFRNGTLGVLTLSTNSTGDLRANFVWKGPRPKFKDERLRWIKDSYSMWCRRSGRSVGFCAHFGDGSAELWQFFPDQKPKLIRRSNDAVKLIADCLKQLPQKNVQLVNHNFTPEEDY
jgi:hypothetical protein